MKTKDWQKFLDNYLTNGTMSPEDYELLTEGQMLFIQELKRSIKRIKRRLNK